MLRAAFAICNECSICLSTKTDSCCVVTCRYLIHNYWEFLGKDEVKVAQGSIRNESALVKIIHDLSHHRMLEARIELQFFYFNCASVGSPFETGTL